MTTVEFVLLLFMNGTELKEYTVRDGMSECLKAKRLASRQLIRSNKSTRYACKKLKIRLDDDNNIVEILD
jgi:hypothetical protein|tara:strand:+ start:921 stop:1130 length:210 start_codon:yes stop_codon:yes gene_type:complete